MPAMTDPSDAMKSFQAALSNGQLRLQQCDLDGDLFVHLDHPNDKPRFTYVRLLDSAVTAFVMLVLADPIDGIPCFQIGYAVPEPCRRRGFARSAVSAAIDELKNGLARAGITTFFVEAVVGTDNSASQRVAVSTISGAPNGITDGVSGLPALQYLRKISG